jgi:AcrR family transcriptional regulator
VRTKTAAQADKILSAAAALFATHRFHEARMEDIAALAEVGKGTLYRYFRDKDELYLALLERAGVGLSERLHRELEGAVGAQAQLVAIVRAILGYFHDSPHLIDLIQHAEVMQRPGQPFPWLKTREETLALTRGVFAEAERVGDFTVEDPELAVLMLLGGLRGVMRFGRGWDAAAVAARIVGDFLHGAARPVASRAAARAKRA